MAATAVFGMAACSSPAAPDAGPESCAAGFLGDEGGAPDFEIQAVLADDTIATIQDGASVPLLSPPQGGRVVFVGVRATGVDACGLQLTGALRNLATGLARVDSRTINLVPTGDGWGASAAPTAPVSAAISSFSNVPVCPNMWSSVDLYGQRYGLEVTIVDRSMRQLTKTIQVTPECAQPANLAQCLCLCMAGYVSGQACGDGGTEGG